MSEEFVATVLPPYTPGGLLTPDLLRDDSIEPNFNGTDQHGADLRFRIGMSLAHIERVVIVATLQACGGSKKRTAEILGVSLKTLYNRLSEYRRSPDGYEDAMRTL